MTGPTTSLLPATPGLDPGDGSPLPVFSFGDQLGELLVGRLLERPVTAETAELVGYRAERLERLAWPVLVAEPDGRVDGRLYRGLSAAELERLDANQGVREGLYRRVSVEVVTARGAEPAAAYLPTGRTLERYG